MERETSKTKKQRQRANMKPAKQACGTLSYLAECRGVAQKAGSIRWAAPPGSIDKSIRK